MPELATPAAPAAPATPAPAAPAAPVAPAPPAPPVTPAAPAAPPVEAPAAPVPPSAATPGKYDPKTASAPPKAEDFPSSEQGIVDQIAANYEWEQAHPEEAAKARHDKAVADGYAEPDPAAPPVEAPQPDAVDPEKPVDPAAPVVAATPAAIDEWVGKSPELKAAFEKSPELRTAVMEMARQNEAAKPILDIVGTVDEAKFAVENANTMVSLQSNWMLAPEGPEMANAAWEKTVELFMERDANGAPVMDAQGKPKLAPDYKPFVQRAATEALSGFTAPLDAAIAQLETNLKGSYPNEQAREADDVKLKDLQYEKLAFEFVSKKLAAGDADSQIPELPPNATPEQIKFQEKLVAERKALDESQGKNKVTERKAARATQDREVQTNYEQGMLTDINTKLAAMKERGEYLPDFVINDKWINPTTGKVTGLSAFGVKIYQQLDAKIGNNPTHKAKLANLQALGNKDARIAELTRLRNLYFPQIFDAEVTRLQNDIRKGSKPATGAPPTPPVARVEPQTTGSVVPGAMTTQQARSWAEGEVRKDPGYQSMSQVDREAAIIEKQFRKQFAG